jgi:ribonucleoside-triphosphate reductase
VACEKSQVAVFFVINSPSSRTRKKRKRNNKMSEPEKTDNVETTAKVDQPVTNQDKNEHMIPKSRFDEVNNANKELKARLEALESASKAAAEKQMVDNQKFEELANVRLAEIEALRPKAAIAEESEKALREFLETQIEELPEHLRIAVPKFGTIKERLDFLKTIKPVIAKPKAFDIGAGRNGGEAPEGIMLTPEQAKVADRLGIKHEDYAKNL